MKINIILPCSGQNPVGGFKVVYEYANALVQRGYDVAVVHPMILDGADIHAYERLRVKAHYYRQRFTHEYRPDTWFRLHQKVKALWVPFLDQKFIPDADVVIATSWQTAEWVSTYTADRGRKYYFIQDYEHFMTATPDVRKRMQLTYAGPFRNIVISPVCTEIVVASGGSVCCQIPNGLDHNVYRLAEQIDSPRRRRIGFPTRNEPFKRTQDAVEALRLFREKSNGDFGFWSFGAKRPQGFPDWIEFHERPTDDELVGLYNQTSIFVVPSEYEGWGLPGSEAMCCGAALVSTDNGGVRAYAEHTRTALLSEPRNIEALADNLLMLASDPHLRKTIAMTGHEQIKQFTWDRATTALEQSLKGEIDERR